MRASPSLVARVDQRRRTRAYTRMMEMRCAPLKLLASHRVPPEVRAMIIGAAADNGENLGNLASVSREWQAIIEPRNFERLKITTDSVSDLNKMTQGHRHHVRYLWLCIEIDVYHPPTHGATDIAHIAHRPLARSAQHNYDTTLWAVETMVQELSDWDHAASNGLTLDISVYSLSDKGRWFEYLTFEPDADIVCFEETKYEPYVPGPEYVGRPNDSWGQQHFRRSICRNVPPRHALETVFERISNVPWTGNVGHEFAWEDDAWQELPQAPIVTKLLLRQQTRRRWHPRAIVAMLESFPGLEELHYEPWREFINYRQSETDTLHRGLLRAGHLEKLQRLTIFENFDPLYPFGYHSCRCHRDRMIDKPLSRNLLDISFGLETLSGAFMFEARDFFDRATDDDCEHKVWHKLRSLHLTSNLLRQDKNKDAIRSMLINAATVANRMPQLEMLEIWNGDRVLATSFKFEFSQAANTACVSWKGTYDLDFTAYLVQAWDGVAAKRCSFSEIKVVNELINEAKIKGHGDAILQLGLSGTVARPVSVKQIRNKQNFLPVEWETE